MVPPPGLAPDRIALNLVIDAAVRLSRCRIRPIARPASCAAERGVRPRLVRKHHEGFKFRALTPPEFWRRGRGSAPRSEFNLMQNSALSCPTVARGFFMGDRNETGNPCPSGGGECAWLGARARGWLAGAAQRVRNARVYSSAQGPPRRSSRGDALGHHRPRLSRRRAGQSSLDARA